MKIWPFSLFLGLLLLLSCSNGESKKEFQKKPVILVTIAPYQTLVQEIVGNTIEVKTIVPAHANAHSYEPRPKEMEGWEKAFVWFLMGEPFEKKVLPVLKKENPSLIVYDLQQDITLLSYEGCCSHSYEKDRHFWLSPTLVSKQCKKIGALLEKQFPEYRSLYQENTKKLEEKLLSLNKEILSILSPLYKRVILVSHPALGYFCHAYNCKQISIEYEGKDPLPKQLEKIIKEAKQDQAEMIVTFPQHGTKGAKVIANTLDLPVEEFDPYAPNYFTNLIYLAKLLAKHP